LWLCFVRILFSSVLNPIPEKQKGGNSGKKKTSPVALARRIRLLGSAMLAGLASRSSRAAYPALARVAVPAGQRRTSINSSEDYGKHLFKGAVADS